MQGNENTVSCREMDALLPLFLDGELDARQMRAVALHGTTCRVCEEELRSLERLRVLVKASITEQMETLDFTRFWDAVESELPSRPRSWQKRLSHWWSESPTVNWNPYLGVAAAAAAAALAFLLLNGNEKPTTQPAVRQIASQENPASIDSIDSDVSSVAVVNDPETHTAVLWVSDDTLVDDGAAR